MEKQYHLSFATENRQQSRIAVKQRTGDGHYFIRTTDVDLESGVISIFNGKGGKDRLVPIHSSLSEYLREYTGKLLLDREWFFPSASGHYSSNTIYENFRELLFMSHIHHTGNGPRVHDFRHTFAVHTLEKQLAEGYDPMIIVPRLAAYLGHKSYRETCWYIRDFLGHVDISTTEVYARIDAEMKRKVFEEKVPNFTPNTTMPWEEDKDLLQWLTKFGKKSF